MAARGRVMGSMLLMAVLASLLTSLVSCGDGRADQSALTEDQNGYPPQEVGTEEAVKIVPSMADSPCKVSSPRSQQSPPNSMEININTRQDQEKNSPTSIKSPMDNSDNSGTYVIVQDEPSVPSTHGGAAESMVVGGALPSCHVSASPPALQQEMQEKFGDIGDCTHHDVVVDVQQERAAVADVTEQSLMVAAAGADGTYCSCAWGDGLEDDIQAVGMWQPATCPWPLAASTAIQGPFYTFVGGGREPSYCQSQSQHSKGTTEERLPTSLTGTGGEVKRVVDACSGAGGRTVVPANGSPVASALETGGDTVLTQEPTYDASATLTGDLVNSHSPHPGTLDPPVLDREKMGREGGDDNCNDGTMPTIACGQEGGSQVQVGHSQRGTSGTSHPLKAVLESNATDSLDEGKRDIKEMESESSSGTADARTGTEVINASLSVTPSSVTHNDTYVPVGDQQIGLDGLPDSVLHGTLLEKKSETGLEQTNGVKSKETTILQGSSPITGPADSAVPPAAHSSAVSDPQHEDRPSRLALGLEEYKKRVLPTQDAALASATNTHRGYPPQPRRKSADGTLYNYAAQSHGAKVISANSQATSASAVLDEDRDKYLRNPCNTKEKWIIIELSENVRVDTIVLASYEFYSSRVKEFQVSGSPRYPTDSWVSLGGFEAQNARQLQTFPVEELSWSRYLKIDFLSHHGTEFYCTLSVIRVHGVSELESLQEGLIEIDKVVEVVESVLRHGGNAAGPALSSQFSANVDPSKGGSEHLDGADPMMSPDPPAKVGNVVEGQRSGPADLQGSKEGVTSAAAHVRGNNGGGGSISLHANTAGSNVESKLVRDGHVSTGIESSGRPEVGRTGDGHVDGPQEPNAQAGGSDHGNGRSTGEFVFKPLMQKLKQLELNQSLFKSYLEEMSHRYLLAFDEVDHLIAMLTERLHNASVAVTLCSSKLAELESASESEIRKLKRDLVLQSDAVAAELQLIRSSMAHVERRETASIIIGVLALVFGGALQCVGSCMQSMKSSRHRHHQHYQENQHLKRNTRLHRLSYCCSCMSLMILFASTGSMIILLSL